MYVMNTNKEVMDRFLKKESARNRKKTLVSNGTELRSSDLVLASWDGDQLQFLEVHHPWIARRVMDLKEMATQRSVATN